MFEIGWLRTALSGTRFGATQELSTVNNPNFLAIGRGRLLLHRSKGPGKFVAGTEPALLGNDGHGKFRRPEQTPRLLKLALADDIARSLAGGGLEMLLEGPP